MVQFTQKAALSPSLTASIRLSLTDDVLAVATNGNTPSRLFHAAPLVDCVAFTNTPPGAISDINSAVAVNPQNDLLYMPVSSANYLYALDHVNETYTNIGPLPSAPNTAFRAIFSADGETLLVGSSGSPRLSAWDCSGGSAVKITNPTTLPDGTVRAIAITADGSLIACGMDSSPYLALYSFSGGVLTRLSGPVDLPPNQARAIAFSPDGSYLFVGNNTTAPRLTVYEVDGTTLTKVSGTPEIAGNVSGLAVSADGKLLAVATSSSFRIFDFNNGVLTENSDFTPISANFNDVAFSPNGLMLAACRTTAPFAYVWDVTYPEPSNIKAFMGEDELEGIRVGTTEVTRAYVGSEQVFGD
jgi:WD40 repeat protein